MAGLDYNNKHNLIKLITRIVIAIIFIPTFLVLSGCAKQSVLTLSGTIESTQIDANAEVAGKVIKIEKDEGSKVNKGDVLAVIDSSVQELNVKQQEAVVKMKQAKLDELKAGTRSEQIKQAEAAVETSKVSINSAKTTVDNSQINYNYWVDKLSQVKSLRESNVSSESDLTDAQYKADTAYQQLLTAQKQLASTQSQLQSAQAQLDLLKSGSTNQTIQAAEADLEQSASALEQAKVILDKYNVKSTIDGTYLTKNINLGDIVNVGTSIATISDLTDLWVYVFIPQKNLDLVKVGNNVDLKTAKGEKISGKVVYIANESEFTPKNTQTSEEKENTVFKVKIQITDKNPQLKPGMTVDAYFPLGGK
jgi:HlyD family secretion protein